jgi:hypothetical protein
MVSIRAKFDVQVLRQRFKAMINGYGCNVNAKDAVYKCGIKV